jgi:hypothetical protein
MMALIKAEAAMDDFEKAQSLSAGFENQNWPLVLADLATRVNRRTLDALASVDDPGPSRRELKELGTRVTRKGHRVLGPLVEAYA